MLVGIVLVVSINRLWGLQVALLAPQGLTLQSGGLPTAHSAQKENIPRIRWVRQSVFVQSALWVHFHRVWALQLVKTALLGAMLPYQAYQRASTALQGLLLQG